MSTAKKYFYYYSGSGGSFNPADIANLSIWFDFSDSSTMSLLGSDVEYVTQKPGAGTTVLGQTDSLRRPDFTASKFGDSAGIQFNKANNDDLRLYTDTSLATTAFEAFTGAFTMFSVVRSDDPAGDNFWHGRTGTTRLEGHTGGKYAIRLVTSADTVYPWDVGTSPTLSTVSRNGSNIVTGSINSTTLSSLFGGAAQIGNFEFDYIGSRAGSFHWSGAIGEILMYNRALTAQEILDVQNYLASKFNVTLS